MKEKAYYEKVNVKNETLLRNLLQKMPPYCKQFFIGIEPTTSSRTRIAYAYDLNCFFDYLHENNPLCSKKDITEIPLSVLGNLAPMDIEEYLSYLKYYEKDGVEHTNDERGLKRKLASLRSFYKYLYKNEFIQSHRKTAEIPRKNKDKRSCYDDITAWNRNPCFRMCRS